MNQLCLEDTLILIFEERTLGRADVRVQTYDATTRTLVFPPVRCVILIMTVGSVVEGTTTRTGPDTLAITSQPHAMSA